MSKIVADFKALMLSGQHEPSLQITAAHNAAEAARLRCQCSQLQEWTEVAVLSDSGSGPADEPSSMSRSLTPISGRVFAVKWFKRYAIGCLIWLILGGINDGYSRPGEDMRWGAIVIVAGFWPIVTAVIVGSSVGEVAHKINEGKLG